MQALFLADKSIDCSLGEKTLRFFNIKKSLTFATILPKKREETNLTEDKRSQVSQCL